MAFFDDALVSRITAEARDVHFGRTILTIIAAVLFGVAWLTARVLSALWLGLAWAVTALRLGWQEGRKAALRPPAQ